MNILIISHYFPPMNSIASLRPLSWAKYWSRDGHSVTVLTSKKNIQSEINPVERENFSVIEYDTIYSRFLSQRQTAKEAISSENDRRAGSIIKFFHSIFGKMGILTWDARMPNMVSTNIRAGYKKVEKKWDLVVSTFSPYSSHLIAYKLKKNGYAKKWIADYRDLWTQSHLYKGLFPFCIIEEFLERQINSSADYLTTVSEPLSQNLKRKYGIENVAVIENGVDLEDITSLPLDKYWVNDNIVRIVYTGSFYKKHQDPTLLFKALKRMKSIGKLSSNCINVFFAGGIKEGLESLISEYDLHDIVQHVGIVSRIDALRMQRDADALLFLNFDAGLTKGVLTGKIFEYIAANKPIIGIGVTVQSDVGKILKDCSNVSFVSSDVGLMENVIDVIITQSKKQTKIDNSSVLKKYSRELLANKMLELIR